MTGATCSRVRTSYRLYSAGVCTGRVSAQAALLRYYVIVGTTLALERSAEAVAIRSKH